MLNLNIKKEDLEKLPLELAKTIPSNWYYEKDYLSLEKEAIFFRTWQYACSAKELKNKGDYKLITLLDENLIIINTGDNKFSGYYNVCKHRSGPLAYENGNCKNFKCKYHGWTYNLEGQLIGTPEFDKVENFEKSNFGLKSFKVDVWEDMIFYNLSEDEAISLAQTFDGIKERISPIDLKTKLFHTRIIYDVKCNWKVYADNYLEGYHLTQVHPELSDLLDYQNYVTEVFPYYSLQYSPFKSGENIYANSDDGQAFYYFVYPNFMLNILPNRLQTNLIVPISETQTKVIFDYYYDNIENIKMIQDDLDYSDIVQQQDIQICETVQKNLASKAYHQGRLSVKRELGVHHFQNLVRDSYNSSLS
jgi:choline monooxygenase